MPAIGLYRIQASRTGQFLGFTEPVFGPDITETLDGVTVTYPEFCSMIFKRLIKGKIAKFPVKRFWKEEYAKASNKTSAPNKMWLTKPKFMICKCTESLGYRIAFPEEVSQEPTYEEMEGKTEILDTDKILEFPSVNGVDKLKQALNISPAETQEIITEEAPEEIVDEGLPIMPIGKYKGKSMDEIPENYLQWLSANNKDYKSLAEQELIRRQAN